MKIILLSLISLLLMVNFCSFAYAGSLEELQLKQAFLQEKIVRMELQFRLLQLEYPQVREELAKVTNQLNQLREKEKK